MSALIPIKSDPTANDRAMAGVRSDKARDATDGYDGGWVAHPGLMPIAMEEFVRVLGDRPNQIDKQHADVQVTASDLLDFRPEEPITEAGLRNNVNVGIHYLGSWLAGNGRVPIHNLIEDAATAKIWRSQVWQWIRSPKRASSTMAARSRPRWCAKSPSTSLRRSSKASAVRPPL